MSSSVERDGIDFDRAKNFWQSLGRRSSSFRDSFIGSSSAAATEGKSEAAAPPPTVGPTTPSPRLTVDPLAPVIPVVSEPTTPPAAPPSPQFSSMESPSQSSIQFPSSESAKNAMNSMFKAFQDTKFFPSAAHETKEESSGGSISSLSTQWKEKMKSYNASRSNSGKTSFSLDRLSAQLKTTLNNVSLTSEAERNAHIAAMQSNVYRPQRRTVHSPVGSPSVASDNDETSPGAAQFGELVVVEVLAGRDLAVGDFFQGESDPYVVVRLRDWERRTVVVKDTKNPVYNERFVFWVAETNPIDGANERLSLTVMNANLVIPDEHLGEVHLLLDIPMEDAFDDWYSLVKDDGLRQGELRIGLRRMKLTSSAMLLAAQSMAASGRSLNDADLATHGATLPTLWYGFAEAAEPVEDRVSQTELLSAKLSDFSRRFMGKEIAPTETTSDGKRRNVF
ncbi:hypothetical protein ATCC90586_010099 [Pythium insidiosum]|nr:hypothetical protein ATCC90586_010099 [Pythium insidiosum]